MPAPSIADARALHVRRVLAVTLGAALVASAALPAALTGVRGARAAGPALPPPVASAPPALVAPASGQLEVFYPVANGSLVHGHWSAATGWYGAENLGGVTVGGAAAAAPSRSSLAVVVRGSDNRLYANTRSAAAWSGWLGLGGILTAKPGVASSAGRLHVFARGTDGGLWTRSQVAGGWTVWESLGGILAPGTGPAATGLADGSLDVVVQGIDGALWEKTRTPRGAWSGWSYLGGRLLNDPAITTPAAGRISVFVRGTTSHVYTKTRSGGSWSAWSDLGGLTTNAPAAAAAAGTGRTDVVVLGTDGRLWQRTGTSAWSGWTAITSASLLKPALGGLMTRGVPDSTQAQYLGGFAVVADWRDLEPARGSYNFAFIDSRLATARKYGMGVRFRILAGTQAPDWAKSIGGPPMPAYDHQRHAQVTIGRFWTPAYQTAWRELQKTLAARYDGDPTVREVNVSGTGVISAEVMLLMANDTSPSTGRTNGSYWLAAGYTEAQRQAALASDIDFMAAAWPRTRVDLCLHVMQTLDASGRTTGSTSATMALWDRARSAHHSLHAYNSGFGMPVITGQQAELRAIYDGLLARRAPMDLQTLNIEAGMGDPATVLTWAAGHGVASLELPSGKTWLNWDKTLLTTTNLRLKANAAAIG